MPAVVPPIIVNEPGDLIVFRSVEDAESYLEPIDVQNGEFVAYDAAGRRVLLSVKSGRRRILFGLLSMETETVALDGTTEDAAAELRAVLVAALTRSEDATTLSSASLADLVRLASERFGR